MVTPYRSTDQDLPEAAERCEFDEFIDQLEKIRVSDLNNEARIQPEFDPIKAKTLSELEEDLKKLLEDSKQETSINGKNHTLQFRPRHQAKSSEKSQGLASRKLPAKRSCQKTLFETSMIPMKRSSTASRKPKTYSASTLLLKNPPLNGLSTLKNQNKIKLSSNISKNWTKQFSKTN